MGIHQIIVQFNYYACRKLVMESPHDTNRFRYFTSYLIYMVIKSKIFIKCNAKEFDCSMTNIHFDVASFQCLPVSRGWPDAAGAARARGGDRPRLPGPHLPQGRANKVTYLYNYIRDELIRSLTFTTTSGTS